jgi:hypothetical protein
MMKTYLCYQNAGPGCENPPRDHQGPLRTFYSYLQVNRHCEGLLMEKYPQLPSPEKVVLLIYIDNVKQNFSAHYKTFFNTFDKLLNSFELPLSFGPKFYIDSNRSQDVARMAAAFEQLRPLGVSDGSYVINSNWKDLYRLTFSMGAVFNAFGLMTNKHEALLSPCVPFSWVEPGAKEEDTCEFATLLSDPHTPSADEQIYLVYYLDLFLFKSRQWLPHIFKILELPVNDIDQEITLFRDGFTEEIDRLSKSTPRTEQEEQWLQHYKDRQSQLNSAANKESFIRFMIEDLKNVLDVLVEIDRESSSNDRIRQPHELIEFYLKSLKTKIQNLQETLIDRAAGVVNGAGSPESASALIDGAGLAVEGSRANQIKIIHIDNPGLHGQILIGAGGIEADVGG